MKQYKAIYWRSNPQLAAGGYETTRDIEARTIQSARKKAQEIADACRYGSMELRQVLLKIGEEERV